MAPTTFKGIHFLILKTAFKDVLRVFTSYKRQATTIFKENTGFYGAPLGSNSLNQFFVADWLLNLRGR